MQPTTLLMPAFAALAAAQSTTVMSIFGFLIKEFDSGANPTAFTTFSSLGGSIAGVNQEHTTYVVDCMSKALTPECNLEAPYTLIAGPTTVRYCTTGHIDLVSVTMPITHDVQCSFTHKIESVVCSVTVSAYYEGVSSTTSTILSVSAGDVTYWPLTVTAGLSELSSIDATTTSTAPTATPSTSTATPSGPISSKQPEITKHSDAAACLRQPLAPAAPLCVAVALVAALF